MGSYLSFLAFKDKPDVAALKALPWLKAFRLYKKKNADQWYLEGPSIQGDSITFYERVYFDREKGKAETEAARKVAAQLKAASGNATTFYDDLLTHALAISRALKIPTFAAFGDDEESDGAYVCENGQVIGGRLLLEGNKALRITAGGSIVAEQLAESESRTLNQILSEEAAHFFGCAETQLYSSDPSEYDASEYELADGVGEAMDDRPKEHAAKAKWWGVQTSSLRASAKAREYVMIIDPYVVAALRPEVIGMTRKLRDPIENNIGNCFLPDHLYGKHKAVAALDAYVSRVFNYLVWLRPSPDYRKSLDFSALRSDMKARWNVLKARLLIGAWLGL